MELSRAGHLVRSLVSIALAAAIAAAFVFNAEAASRARRPRAAPAQCPATGTKPIAFSKALDGRSFAAEDGAVIRLSGVLDPEAAGLPVSAAQQKASRKALEDLLKPGSLTAAETGKDRYGRILAHLFANAVPVAQALVRGGYLRASPDAPSAPCASLLLKAEEEARSSGAAFWGAGLYKVLAPDELRGRLGTFQIVEGTIASAAQIRGRMYVNFGADYRKDFTVTVASAEMRAFRRAKLDPKSLPGQIGRAHV